MSEEPFAYTPDDEVEAGTARFRELWPEKWEAWLRWCESEDAK